MSKEPWPSWNQDIEKRKVMTDHKLMQKAAETINEFVHHNKANWTETLRLLNERLAQLDSGQELLGYIVEQDDLDQLSDLADQQDEEHVDNWFCRCCGASIWGGQRWAIEEKRKEGV